MLKNVYPIHKKFLVKADEADERSSAGIWLSEKTAKYTGTVVQLPYGVVGIDTDDEELYEKKSEIKGLGAGRLITAGSRIQWSSQSGFAIPVTIEDDAYLLFSIHDVDLILTDG